MDNGDTQNLFPYANESFDGLHELMSCDITEIFLIGTILQCRPLAP